MHRKMMIQMMFMRQFSPRLWPTSKSRHESDHSGLQRSVAAALPLQQEGLVFASCRLQASSRQDALTTSQLLRVCCNSSGQQRKESKAAQVRLQDKGR